MANMLRVVAEGRTHENRLTQKTPYRSGAVLDIRHDFIETLSHYDIEYRQPRWLMEKALGLVLDAHGEMTEP